MINNFYSSVSNGNQIDKCLHKQHYVPELIYLLKSNFLGEYRTALEKAKVRANLGIADEETLFWGNILGYIEDQKDIALYINNLLAFDYTKNNNFDHGEKFEKIKNVRDAAITCLDYLIKFKNLEEQLKETNIRITDIIKNLYGVESLDLIEDSDKGAINTLVNDLIALREALGNTNTAVSEIEERVTTVESDIDTINDSLARINELIQIAEDETNALVMLEDKVITELLPKFDEEGLPVLDEKGNQVLEEVQVTKKGGLYVKDLTGEVKTLLGQVQTLQSDAEHFLTKEDFGSDELDFVTPDELTGTLQNYVRTGSDATLNSVTTNAVTTQTLSTKEISTNKITSTKNTIEVDKPFDFADNVGPGDPRLHVKTQADLLRINPVDAWKGMPVVVEDDAIMYILTKEPTEETIGNLTNWKSADSLSIEVCTFLEYKEKKALGKLNPGIYYYIIEEDIDLKEVPSIELYIDANGKVSEKNLEAYKEAVKLWYDATYMLHGQYMSAVWGLEMEKKLNNKTNNSDFNYLKAKVDLLLGDSANLEQLKELENQINDLNKEIFGETTGTTRPGRLIKVEDTVVKIIKDLYATDVDGLPITELSPTFVTWEALGSLSGNLGEGESLFVKTSTYNKDKEDLALKLETNKVVLEGTNVVVGDSIRVPDKKTLKVENETLALESDLLKIKDFDTYEEYLAYVANHENDPDFSDWYFVVKEVTFGQLDEQLTTKGVVSEMIKLSADTKVDKTTLQNLWSGYYHDGIYTPLSTIINDILSGGNGEGLENVYNLQLIKLLIDAICAVLGLNDNNFRTNLKNWINGLITGEGSDATSELNYVPNTKYIKDWELVTTLKEIVNSLLGEGENAKKVLFEAEQAKIPSIKSTLDNFTIEKKDSEDLLLTVKKSGEVLNSSGELLGLDKDIPYIVWCEDLDDYKEKVNTPITDNPNDREVLYVIKDLEPGSDDLADNCYMTLALFKLYAVTKKQMQDLSEAWGNYRTTLQGENSKDLFGNLLYEYQTLSTIVENWKTKDIPEEIARQLLDKASTTQLNEGLATKVDLTDYNTYKETVSSNFTAASGERAIITTNLNTAVGKINANEKNIEDLDKNKLEKSEYTTFKGQITTTASEITRRVTALEEGAVSNKDLEDLKTYCDKNHSNLFRVTYSNLKTLIEESKLIPGAYYEITNYLTTVNSSDYLVDWRGFTVIIQAISENKLSKIGKAHSTYYSNADKWYIEYTIENINLSSEDGTGTITKLIDDRGNSAPFDFKSIKIKKYRIEKLSLDTRSVEDLWIHLKYIGAAGGYYTTSSTDIKYIYTFSTVDYEDASLIDNCVNNKVENIGNIIFGGSNNYCSGENNVLYITCNNCNILGNNNLVGSGSEYITIEKGAKGNVLYPGSYITIETNTEYCLIYEGCSNITLGNSCYLIRLGSNCERVIFLGNNKTCKLDLPYALDIEVHYGSSYFTFNYSNVNITPSDSNKLRFVRIEIFGNTSANIATRSIVAEELISDLITTFYLKDGIVDTYYVANLASDLANLAVAYSQASNKITLNANNINNLQATTISQETKIASLDAYVLEIIKSLKNNFNIEIKVENNG